MSRQLSKKTLDKSFWNWFFWNGCSQQAESMLGLAFGQAMAPVVDELYDSKEEKAEALKRHVTLFNTEAQVGSICNGIVCGMEEANANGQCTPDVINTVKAVSYTHLDVYKRQYDSLAEYESNREEYPCIDDYLQVLIPLYLEGR